MWPFPKSSILWLFTAADLWRVDDLAVALSRLTATEEKDGRHAMTWKHFQVSPDPPKGRSLNLTMLVRGFILKIAGRNSPFLFTVYTLNLFYRILKNRLFSLPLTHLKTRLREGTGPLHTSQPLVVYVCGSPGVTTSLLASVNLEPITYPLL